MHFKSFVLTACCLAPLFSATALLAQDLSSPESAVRSYWTAYCKGDFAAATACIENAKYNSAFDAMAQDQKSHPATFTIKDVRTDLNGDAALVQMYVTIKEPRAGQSQSFTSAVNLHRSNDVWRIKADIESAKPSSSGNMDQINMIAWALSDPHSMLPMFAEARNTARAQMCLSNLKQLGLGARMYSQDFDEKFMFKAVAYGKAIMPYIKNQAVFHCPSDDAGVLSYSFNANLAGGGVPSKPNLASILVLIYEGKAGKLDYKHDGRAAVCFADGHCDMISEMDAKKLRWKP